MREQARDTMIRDKFIAGQEHCALRRQLDGFAQDTPIGEIVDSCRVWESHSDSDRMAGKRVELEADDQSGDSRMWERNKVTVVVDNGEPGREAREEVSDSQRIKWLKILWDSCEPFLKAQLSQNSGNEQGFERAGQPLGPQRIKAPLTLGGGGGVPTLIKKGCPLGRCRQWMKGLINGEWMVRNSLHWGRRRQQVRSSDQLLPVIRGGAGHGKDSRVRLPGWWTGGCDRHRLAGQFGKETAMFGHKVFTVP